MKVLGIFGNLKTSYSRHSEKKKITMFIMKIVKVRSFNHKNLISLILLKSRHQFQKKKENKTKGLLTFW